MVDNLSRRPERSRLRVVLSLRVGLSMIAGILAFGCHAGPRTDVASAGRYGNLPLSFEENRGQTDPRVKFLTRSASSSMFLTPTGVVLKLRGRSPEMTGATRSDPHP